MSARIKALLVEKLHGGLARNSVRLIHATLRVLLNAAVDDGIILANPADKLAKTLHLVRTVAAREEQIKALSREQLGASVALDSPISERSASGMVAKWSQRQDQGAPVTRQPPDFVGEP